ncbi:MAG: response regulator transcription factor [Pirellulaceae bacterium]
MMQGPPATVYVIDDDPSVRAALARLLRSAGLNASTFASAEAFLNANLPTENACAIADVRMPGMSGLQLQHELTKAGSPLRLVFVTAQDLEETRGEAVRSGCVAFLIKPVDDLVLLEAIEAAFG